MGSNSGALDQRQALIGHVEGKHKPRKKKKKQHFLKGKCPATGKGAWSKLS